MQKLEQRSPPTADCSTTRQVNSSSSFFRHNHQAFQTTGSHGSRLSTLSLRPKVTHQNATRTLNTNNNDAKGNSCLSSSSIGEASHPNRTFRRGLHVRNQVLFSVRDERSHHQSRRHLATSSSASSTGDVTGNNDLQSQQSRGTTHENKEDHHQSSTTNSSLFLNDPFLKPLQSVLATKSPGFAVSGDSINVIPDPSTFYQTLLTSLSKAKHRICLSSLYLGTEAEEIELVNVIDTALSQNPQLCVHTLFDFHRGQRIDKDGRSSYSMFVELSHKYPGRVCAALFTPPCKYDDTYDSLFTTNKEHGEPSLAYRIGSSLRHLLRNQVKGRAKELFSVHHMKAYTIDDSTIISGANLSKIYFTNRQDRYIQIRDKNLSDFITSVIQLLTYGDNSNGQYTYIPSTQKHETNTESKQSSSPVEFMDNPNNDYFNILPYKTIHTTKEDQLRSLQTIFSENSMDIVWKTRQQKHQVEQGDHDGSLSSSPHTPVLDTIIYPTLQLPSMGIRHDQYTTSDTLNVMTHNSLPIKSDSNQHNISGLNMYIATGYFNMSPAFIKLFDTMSSIYRQSSAVQHGTTPSPAEDKNSSQQMNTDHVKSNTELNVTIMAASKEANGWFNAKGITGLVPDVYKKIIDNFNTQAFTRWNTPQESTSPMVNIHTVEYNRPEWSFHAKGIYAQPQHYKLSSDDNGENPNTTPISSSQLDYKYLDPRKPLYTTIGSSNYGVRSTDLDSELQFAILTNNEKLIAAFDDDLDRTLAHSKLIPRDSPHWKVNALQPLLRHFL